MGSAASIQEQIQKSQFVESGLPESTQNEIKEILQNEYESLKSEGKDENEIHEILSNSYQREYNLRVVPKEENSTSTGTGNTTTTGTGAEQVNTAHNTPKINQGLDNKKKRIPDKSLDQNIAQRSSNKARDKDSIRRRSFGGQPTKAIKELEKLKEADTELGKEPKNEANPLENQAQLELAISESISSLNPNQETDNPVGDSWDSVTQQAYCLVCKTTFRSLGLLKKHEAHSVIHAENAKKQQQQTLLAEAGETLSSTNAPDVPLSPSSSDPNTSSYQMNLTKEERDRQVLGKMIYHGSKFFWRTQENLDLHFYLHTSNSLSVIEVIPYDIIKGKELNRIFMNFNILESLISEENVLVKIEELRKDHSKDKFATVPTDAMMRDYAEQLVLTTFVLARLQKQSGMDVAYVACGTDPPQLNPVLPGPPSFIKRSFPMRKRRTSTEEIMTTISHLNEDRAALANATIHAEKISNLVHQGAKLFKTAHEEDTTNLSPMTRLWKWAIHKVVNQGRVFKTTMILENMRNKVAAKAAEALQLTGEKEKEKEQKKPEFLISSSSSEHMRTSSSISSMTISSKQKHRIIRKSL